MHSYEIPSEGDIFILYEDKIHVVLKHTLMKKCKG